MTARSNDREDELLRLISAQLDGEISPGGRERLAHLLRESVAARATYFDFIMLAGGLATKAERLAAIKELPTLPQMPRGKRSWHVLQKLASNNLALSVLVALFSISAILVVMAILVPHSSFSIPGWQATPAVPSIVARITDSKNAVWNVASDGHTTHTGLTAGEQVILDSGLAELYFADGTQVIVQGPATLRVDSTSLGTLQQGSLTATVPAEAVGFAMETPQARITDLGTAFGVQVVPRQFAEVYVYEGRVSCAPLEGASFAEEIVSAGEGLRLLPQEAIALNNEEIAAQLTLDGDARGDNADGENFRYDFSRDQYTISLVGDALFVVDNALSETQRLRLTDNNTGRMGSAWHTEKLPVMDGFSTKVQFQLSFPRQEPADGFGLILQNTSAATQLSVDELGPDADGLSISIDTHANLGDIETPYVSVICHDERLASASLHSQLGEEGLTDGQMHSMQAVYRQGKLSVRVDGKLVIREVAVDLASLPNGSAVDAQGNAWVGFAARTGNYGQNHDLLKWDFQSFSQPTEE